MDDYGFQFPPTTMGGYPIPHWCGRAGVKVRHIKTGFTAIHHEERSITMNKVMALRKLRALLAFNEWNGATSGDVGIVKDWTPESLEEMTRRYDL